MRTRRPFKLKQFLTLASGLLALGLVPNGHGQSADALISKLVQKGILTTEEAADLRKETVKDFTKAYAAKTDLADWVTSLKFHGDVRVRFDDTFSDNSAFVTRQRYRMRVRFGAVAKLADDMEVGLRLTSGVDNNGLTGNQTFENNGSKKPIFLDQVYGRWSPRLNDEASFVFTAGKMESPFVFSELVIDMDYTPEGFAQQFNYAFNKKHSAKIILGEFVLDELSASGSDPFLFGAQMRLDSQWNKRVATTFGVAGLTILNASTLTTNNVPDINSGNTRNGAVLANNFNPLIADGSVKYTLDSFPLYRGAFPIGVSGEFMWNPAASSRNVAWSAGPTFGKAGKKGTWEISYRWKSLENDAWYEELVSDDFGAFYQSASGFGPSGFRAGTNVRGHVVKAAYAFTDSMTLGLSYFNTELIDASPAGSISGMQRIFVDALWKF